MVTIENQIAVVTGAGRGIGKAIAIELGALGAHVTLAARSSAELEATARIIGSRSDIVQTDVRNKADIIRLLSKPVDILVNAAGLGIFGPVADFTDDDFQTLIDTNLRGIFFACRSVLPSMIERKRGHIINIASIAGKVGSAIWHPSIGHLSRFNGYRIFI
jgi:NADP-dependent 3-hydroxy acid dehydrogenase YdfG